MNVLTDATVLVNTFFSFYADSYFTNLFREARHVAEKERGEKGLQHKVPYILTLRYLPSSASFKAGYRGTFSTLGLAFTLNPYPNFRDLRDDHHG